MYRWRVEINFLQITFQMPIAVTLMVWLMPLQTGSKRREPERERWGGNEREEMEE